MGDVAIVGMACLFPGAPDLKTYWQNIVNKVDAVGDPPVDWGGDFCFDPESNENDKIYCKRGGYLGDISKFDPLEFGIMPMSVDGAEPEHFLALRVAHEALKDAGIPDIPINRDRTEVILGRGTFVNRGYTTLHQHGLFIDQTLSVLKELHPHYTEDKLKLIKQQLKAKLPPFTAQTAPGLVSTIMSGRIANRLDLRGANFSVDAACSSSLIAVELGVQDLLSGKCDAVIAGGVQLTTHHLVLMVFCQLGALSRKYQIRPFDKNADGTLLGEGVGMAVLKRREDAERDGNRIYALIKGVGSSSDGRAKSVVAPRQEGEELAIRRAYEAAGISPSTIGLIEAHGTAMPLGDVTEIKALSNVFGSQNERPSRCGLGSVKSMIAHLIPASGMAGLIKTSLALYHKVMPPTLHCDEPNPQLELEKSPFYINTETRPWIHGSHDAPRRAAINAFGFGGINAHAIIEEYPPKEESSVESYQHAWNSELCILSAATLHELIDQAERVHEFLSLAPRTELKDAAYTLNSGILGKALRLAIVASSSDELKRKVAHALKRLKDPSCLQIKDKSGIYYFKEPLAGRGKLAFLFPGEGSQYLNMLSDLCIHFPEVRRCFDILDRAFAGNQRNYLPSSVIFPPPAFTKEGRDEQERKIWHMEGGVDAVITADRAIYRLLRKLGIEPHAVVGHSSGEFMSLEAAGAVEYQTEDELIDYIQKGNKVIERISSSDSIPSTPLYAVGGIDRAEAAKVISQTDRAIFIAMDNCLNQLVLCGQKGETEEALKRLQAKGAICQTLPFTRPYHSPLFAPAEGLLQEFFEGLKIASPKTQLYSCMTAAVMPSEPAQIRKLAVAQWANRVRFRETVEAMYSDGVRIFLEVGPRANLTGFVKDTLIGKPFLAVSSNVHHKPGITQLHHALGLLAAHGTAMHLDYLYSRRSPKKLDFGKGEQPTDREPKRIMPKLHLSLPILSIQTKALDIPPSAGEKNAAQAPLAPFVHGLADRQIGDPSAAIREQGEAEEDFTRLAVPTAEQAQKRNTNGLNPKAKVMAQYLHSMEQFLDDQKKIMHAYMTNAAPRAGLRAPVRTEPDLHPADVDRIAASVRTDCLDRREAAGPAIHLDSMPFIEKIVSCKPGHELTATRKFDLAEDVFLLDHTLGRDISETDKSLTGLPLMPLTVSLEIMAEAATLLITRKILIGMREVRAYRWIAFEKENLVVKITAKHISADEVKVQIWEVLDELAEETPSGLPSVEGIMLFGEKYPEPPAVDEFSLKGKRRSIWTSDALYSEGMFSGPNFRGMSSVDWWGEDGGEATLKALPLNGFFKSRQDPRFVIDHVLLDAAGQLIAYWIADHRETGFNVYPFRIAALHIYGPILQAGELAACRARIVPLAESQLRSDIEILGPDGQLRMKLLGWDDRSFDLPSSFYKIRFKPKEVFLSDSWPAPIAAFPEAAMLQCRLMRDFPDNLLHAHGKVWLAVLAHLALSSKEREVWSDLKGSEKRRTEWLLARVAAKDAARMLVRECHGRELCLPDIEIATDTYGRPSVEGATRETGVAPSVSIAHKNGIGVALACGNGGDCGVDMEIISAASRGTSRHSLKEEELALVNSQPTSEDAEWPLRIWCAKEAVGKALGRGLHGGPWNFMARELNPETGLVVLQAAEGLLRDIPGLAGQRFQSYTTRESDFIAACAVLKKME